MFFHTDTADSPWTVVKSDDKKRARLHAMPTCCTPCPTRTRMLSALVRSTIFWSAAPISSTSATSTTSQTDAMRGKGKLAPRYRSLRAVEIDIRRMSYLLRFRALRLAALRRSRRACLAPNLKAIVKSTKFGLGAVLLSGLTCHSHRSGEPARTVLIGFETGRSTSPLQCPILRVLATAWSRVSSRDAATAIATCSIRCEGPARAAREAGFEKYGDHAAGFERAEYLATQIVQWNHLGR